MTVDFEVNNKIATITLNRPESLNAMTPEMYKKLSESWVEVRDNPDIWVAVIAGAGQPNRPPEKQVFWQTQEDQILNRGLEVWKPVVAAVNGLCLAGGMTLLLATDIRIGSEHSAYDLSEVKRGILPGNGGTQRTIRQLPYPIAMEVLLMGGRLSADHAADLQDHQVEGRETLFGALRRLWQAALAGAASRPPTFWLLARRLPACQCPSSLRPERQAGLTP